MSAALRTGNDNNDAPVKLEKHSLNVRNGLARGSRLVLPAMAALGIGGPASAFELGALDVHSTLGQPLRASIAFALNPGEEIRSYCIYLNRGRAANGLPSAGPASVVVENGTIRVFGETAVSDPLLALQVTVDCPYAAHLTREYVAFVDPALTASEPATVQAPRNEVRRTAASARRTEARAPVAISTAAASYRVQPGDTLSGIAQRLSGRSVTIWQAVEALYAANPDAFIGNDRDLLKAGALLRVPDAIYAADGGAVVAPASAQRAAEQAEAPQPASAAYSGYRSEAERIESGRAALAASPAQVPSVNAESAPQRAAGADETAVNASGEVRAARDFAIDRGPFVEPDAAEAVAPPADLAPAAILPEDRPAVRFEAPLSRENGGGAWSWLMWLGGSGIGLILALLLLGRPLRRRLGGETELRFGEDRQDDRRRARGAAPAAGTPEPLPIVASVPAAQTSGMEVDFHVDEGPADAGLLMAGGDGEEGSDFRDSGDIDVAQDFGFSASGGIEFGLDVDFAGEPAASGTGDTNVIPPIRRAGDVIVEEEIPPASDETGAYDVSMIVDATQQPLGDGDDTTRDL
ncbi:MAG TPA: FimV/HubP family polar landmark protein, partial [Woeseiaceae bacterium]|nr:FimV/HubP family polar landmark protein [Woeseiaceae bacterium]